MKLHTVFVTYNRLDLTKRSIVSYLETVTVPFSLVVVDNGSSDGSADFLLSWLYEGLGWPVLALGENRYPGYACNRGWEMAPGDCTFFHRADNDFIYRNEWCSEVERQFSDLRIGQVGLRTDKEELYAPWNVGGNCVIRRDLWDQGLRYDETPWPLLPAGYSEDSYFSPAVKEMGYEWTRVERPCIIPISTEDPNDPYYQETWAARRINQS